MRLIRIHHSEDTYIVDALTCWELFGMEFFSRIKSFEKRQDGYWYEVSGSSKVSARKERKLNKWLADHEKFIVSAPRSRTQQEERDYSIDGGFAIGS